MRVAQQLACASSSATPSSFNSNSNNNSERAALALATRPNLNLNSNNNGACSRSGNNTDNNFEEANNPFAANFSFAAMAAASSTSQSSRSNHYASLTDTRRQTGRHNSHGRPKRCHETLGAHRLLSGAQNAPESNQQEMRILMAGKNHQRFDLDLFAHHYRAAAAQVSAAANNSSPLVGGSIAVAAAAAAAAAAMDPNLRLGGGGAGGISAADVGGVSQSDLFRHASNLASSSLFHASDGPAHLHASNSRNFNAHQQSLANASLWSQPADQQQRRNSHAERSLSLALLAASNPPEAHSISITTTTFARAPSATTPPPPPTHQSGHRHASGASGSEVRKASYLIDDILELTVTTTSERDSLSGHNVATKSNPTGDNLEEVSTSDLVICDHKRSCLSSQEGSEQTSGEARNVGGCCGAMGDEEDETAPSRANDLDMLTGDIIDVVDD